MQRSVEATCPCWFLAWKYTVATVSQSGSDSEEQRRFFSFMLSQAQGPASAWGRTAWGRNNRREEMGQRGEE